MNQESAEQKAFHELSYYTLTQRDPSFIHQYVVDAFAAQYAHEHTKPITLAFALIGLYLYLEKNFSGREVQLAHMKLAKHKKRWPTFDLPEYRGNATVFDVIAAPEGPKRDEAIHRWCAAVWDAYQGNHRKVENLVQTELWG